MYKNILIGLLVIIIVVLALTVFVSIPGTQLGEINLKQDIAQSPVSSTLAPLIESTSITAETPKETTHEAYPMGNVTIIAPQTGSVWKAGSGYQVQWIPKNGETSTIQLDLIRVEGNDYYVVVPIAKGLLDYIPHYYWTIPVTVSPGKYQVQAIRYDNSERPIDTGMGGIFTITAPSTTATVTSAPVTVFEPNNGERWLMGSTRDIRFNIANPAYPLSIFIADAENKDRYWLIAEIPSPVGGANKKSWVVGEGQPLNMSKGPILPGSYVVSVCEDHPAQYVCDQSDAPFTIWSTTQ